MTVDTQGLIACSRYSFAPNSLHFCGPERQNDMLGYVTSGKADNGLVEILHRFETLYPYLVLIAAANNIKDPFDRRVVESYWLGNSLLHSVKTRALATHLADDLRLTVKLSKKHLNLMMNSVMVSGIPQHNFHVFNVFIRTGHHAVAHTLPTMDECRISWGRVVDTQSQCVISTRPLSYRQDQLLLDRPVHKVVTSLAVKPKKGDWVSVHWGYVCDILTPQKRANIIVYTQKALRAANAINVIQRV